MLLPFLLSLLLVTSNAQKPSFNCTFPGLPDTLKLPNSTFFNAIVQLKSPYVMVKPDSSIKGQPGEEYHGVAIDVWESIVECLGLTYNYSRLSYNVVAASDDVVNAVASGRFDVAVASIGVTKDREQIVDFTQPYEDTALGLLSTTGYTGDRDLWQFAQPFQPSVWYMILISLLIGIVILAMFNTGRFVLHGMHSVAENRAMRAEVEEGDWWAGIGWTNPFSRYGREIFHALWQFFTVGLQQGDMEVVGRSIESYVIWGAWILFTVIVYSAYQGSLTAFLTTSLVNANAITGWSSLKAGDSLAVRLGSDAEKYVLRSVPPGVRVTSVRTLDEIVSLVSNNSVSAGVDDHSSLGYVSASDCFVGPVGSTFYPKGNSLFVQQDSTWGPIFSTIILEMKEQGYVDDLMDYYTGLVVTGCAVQVAAAMQSDLGVLDWTNFQGLLIIWGSAATLALGLAIARFAWVRIGADKEMQRYVKSISSDGSVETSDVKAEVFRQTEYGHSHAQHLAGAYNDNTIHHTPSQSSINVVQANGQATGNSLPRPIIPGRTITVDSSLQVRMPLSPTMSPPSSPVEYHVPAGPLRSNTNGIAGTHLYDDMLHPPPVHWNSMNITDSRLSMDEGHTAFVPVSTDKKISELEQKLALIVEKLAIGGVGGIGK